MEIRYKKNDLFSFLAMAFVAVGMGFNGTAALCAAESEKQELAPSKQEIEVKMSQQPQEWRSDELRKRLKRLKRPEGAITPDDIFSCLPEVQDEINTFKTGTNTFDIMPSVIVREKRWDSIKDLGLYILFIDGWNNCIGAMLRGGRVNYFLSDSSEPDHIDFVAKRAVELSLYQNARDGFVLRDKEPRPDGSRDYYVFSTSGQGPRFEHALELNNDDCLFGGERLGSYFSDSYSKVEVGCVIGFSRDKQHVWQKNAFLDLLDGEFRGDEGVQDVRISACTQDMSRLAIVAILEDPSGNSNNVFIVDGLTGKCLSRCTLGDQIGVEVAFAHHDKSYVIVAADGRISYYNESHKRYETHRVDSLRDGVISMQASPDLSRIMLSDDKKRVLFYRDIGRAFTLPNESWQNGRAICDPMLQKICYVKSGQQPIMGDLDSSLINLRPLAADFLHSFKGALQLVEAERKRVEDGIERHKKIHAKNPGWVYFHSRARIIIYEGSDLHKAFKAVPLSIRKQLWQNYGNWARIYPADHPQENFGSLEETESCIHLGKIMSALRQTHALAQKKSLGNKRKKASQ